MPRLAIEEEQLARFCRKQNIRRLSLFGSMLAGTQRPDSDVNRRSKEEHSDS
jgi:predicted nucleotidyltransferase